MHRVDGHDGALERQKFQQLRDRRDLVGLVGNFLLTKHKALTGAEGRDHMNGPLSPGLPVAAAQGLAVDGDDVSGKSAQRRNPVDETALESLGVEHGKDVAKLIMGRRAVLERREAAQEIPPLFTEFGNLHPAVRTAKDCDQRQKQHFGKRIENLYNLSRIRQILEMGKKNNFLVLEILCLAHLLSS